MLLFELVYGSFTMGSKSSLNMGCFHLTIVSQLLVFFRSFPIRTFSVLEGVLDVLLEDSR
jgi:hypothetical protein